MTAKASWSEFRLTAAITLEIPGGSDAAARISESLAALGRGEHGADLDTVRADFARRRHTGT
jgi:antitoxin YefM